MNTSTTTKPARWFWVISVVAVIWNAMGVLAYFAHVYMTDEQMAAYPEAEQALMAATPSWAVAAFAISVFAGLLAAIFLVMRRKWAFPVFIISLVAILTQNLYWLVLSDTFKVMGASAMIMPGFVILIAIFLIWFAKSSASKGWLR